MRWISVYFIILLCTQPNPTSSKPEITVGRALIIQMKLTILLMKRYIITPTASRNPFVFINIESDPHCHTNPPKIQNSMKILLETSINNSMQTSIFAEYSNKNSKKPLKNIPLICCPFQNKLKIFKIQPIECTASEKDSLPSKKINPNTKEPHVV